jgi:hypothetical protein
MSAEILRFPRQRASVIFLTRERNEPGWLVLAGEHGWLHGSRLEASAMVSVYDGRQCIGFVLARGKEGFEAFDAGERGLGTYRTEREAAAAVMRGSP